MTWTHFHDMRSGGGTKEGVSHIYIEAAEAEATAIFCTRFGHHPSRVSCDCCGEDYAIDEYPTLAEATWYERGCSKPGIEEPARVFGFGVSKYMTLEQYKEAVNAIYIYTS